MSNLFTSSINTLGNSKGNSKSAIDADIYEAVCIGIADAGTSTKTWQGKEKQVANLVLVWQLDHINGFGSQSVVTDWVQPSGHENSNFTKNFLTPAKLKVNNLGELVGKAVRVEIEIGENGYPQITRYFASKKPIDVAEGLYLPAWIITKGYPTRTHDKVLAGARPVAVKAEGAETAPTAEEKAAGDSLPF